LVQPQQKWPQNLRFFLAARVSEGEWR